MNAKSLLKSSLRALLRSCNKYKVDFDEILEEVGEEGIYSIKEVKDDDIDRETS